MTEAERVQALIRREEGAWEAFLDLYGAVLDRAIRRAGVPADQVDDLIGEICVRLLAEDGRRLKAFRGDCALSTWLWHLARGAALDHARRRVPGPLGDLEIPAPAPALLDETERIREALKRLPERSRAALRMAFWEEKSYAEIARALGVSPESVGPLLARAKEELSGILDRKGEAKPTKVP